MTANARRLSVGALATLVLSVGAWTAWGDLCVELGTPPTYRGEPLAEGPILVVGDLQRTSFVERVFLGREENGAASEKLLREMAEENPRFVVLLGDLVFDGDRCGDWERADRLLSPLRATQAGFLVAPGNHDWQGRDGLCRAHMQARFRHLRDAPWAERRVGDIVFVQLDSNTDVLEDRWDAQSRHFVERLTALDADDAVRGIIVLTHHPPFTNSAVTGDEEHVEEAFVGPFLEADKTLAFFSGHAHAYERFSVGGKTFVVSGGGGGPRVALLEGEDARHEDLFSGPSPRPFHYLRLHPGPDAVEVRVRGFASGQLGVSEIDRFDLDYP